MPPPLEEHFVDPQHEKVNIHEVGHLKETWGVPVCSSFSSSSLTSFSLRSKANLSLVSEAQNLEEPLPPRIFARNGSLKWETCKRRCRNSREGQNIEILSIYNSNISLTSLTMIVATLISSLLSLSPPK